MTTKTTASSRSVCLPRTSPTHLFSFLGLEPFGSIDAPTAVNAGISPSTVLNVQVPCLLTALCTWVLLGLKILTVSAILRVTVTTSTKERCAWDSGLAIVPVWETLTLTRVGIQCPGSLSRKFLRLSLRLTILSIVQYKHVERKLLIF